MTLADKIMTLRKQNGWSQEELAEKLGVTRQSVSKWENGVAIPDLDKIILLSDLFGVTTDHLLKKEAELTPPEPAAAEVRILTRDEACSFMDDRQLFAKRLARSVAMCILSPIALILLSGLAATTDPPRLSENAAAGIGLAVLFLLVAAAVVQFVIYGLQIGKYHYIQTETFVLAPGVAELAAERKRQYERKYVASMAIGVAMCILSVIPVVIAGVIPAADMAVLIAVAVLLAVVAGAVYLFVSAYTVWSTYRQLLQEDEYTWESKVSNKRSEKFAAVYWPLVVAIYLAYSFITGRWNISWVIWPIAGLLFGGISAALSMGKTE